MNLGALLPVSFFPATIDSEVGRHNLRYETVQCPTRKKARSSRVIGRFGLLVCVWEARPARVQI